MCEVSTFYSSSVYQRNSSTTKGKYFYQVSNQNCQSKSFRQVSSQVHLLKLQYVVENLNLSFSFISIVVYSNLDVSGVSGIVIFRKRLLNAGTKENLHEPTVYNRNGLESCRFLPTWAAIVGGCYFRH